MPENTNGGAEIGCQERAVGERKGIDLAQDVAASPDPELVERARRRRFSAEYKLRILREADACSKPGEVGCVAAPRGLVLVVVDGVAPPARARVACGARSSAWASEG